MDTLIANRWCIVDVDFYRSQMLLVGVRQIYTNKRVYLCNTVLVRPIFAIDIQQLIISLINNVFNEIWCPF